MTSNYYAEFVRTRITELRIARGVSEYCIRRSPAAAGAVVNGSSAVTAAAV